MINKEGKDVRPEELTPETYVVKPGEERFYHCVIDTPQYDQKTGKKVSVARVQKFGRKSFENTIERSLKRMGYTVTILHDPNRWMSEQAAMKAEQEARRQEEEEQAEADRKAAEKAAMKEEIMEELKAAGIIPESGVQPAKKQAQNNNAK